MQRNLFMRIRIFVEQKNYTIYVPRQQITARANLKHCIVRAGFIATLFCLHLPFYLRLRIALRK